MIISCRRCPNFDRCRVLGIGSAPLFEPRFAHLRAKSTIVAAGQTCQTFTILCVGYAAKSNAIGKDRRQIVTLYRPGTSLLSIEHHQEVVTQPIHALGETQVAYVSMPRILQRAMTDPATMQEVLRRSREREYRMSQLLTLNGKATGLERLATFFTWLIQASSIPATNNTCALPVIMRQEDMADLLGLTLTHLNRTLSAMRSSGLVTTNGDMWIINDVTSMTAKATQSVEIG